MQNCGATVTADGRTIAVTEDVRNGNGRAIKSRLWSPNRIDRIDEPLNAIFWLMHDPTISPVLKLEGPSLASVMGATLATKRTTAEHLLDLSVPPYSRPLQSIRCDTYMTTARITNNPILPASKAYVSICISTKTYTYRQVSSAPTVNAVRLIFSMPAI